jgi:hypothetical protein
MPNGEAAATVNPCTILEFCASASRTLVPLRQLPSSRTLSRISAKGRNRFRAWPLIAMPPLLCGDLRTCPNPGDGRYHWRCLGIFAVRKMRKTLRMLIPSSSAASALVVPASTKANTCSALARAVGMPPRYLPSAFALAMRRTSWICACHSQTKSEK